MSLFSSECTTYAFSDKSDRKAPHPKGGISSDNRGERAFHDSESDCEDIFHDALSELSPVAGSRGDSEDSAQNESLLPPIDSHLHHRHYHPFHHHQLFFPPLTQYQQEQQQQRRSDQSDSSGVFSSVGSSDQLIAFTALQSSDRIHTSSMGQSMVGMPTHTPYELPSSISSFPGTTVAFSAAATIESSTNTSIATEMLSDDGGGEGELVLEGPLTAEQQQQVFERALALINFYFGEANYSKDQFLRKQAALDPLGQGWISVDVIVSFKKMKKITEDRDLVLKAMYACPMVVLSDDGMRIRRKEVLAKDIEV